MMEEKAKVEDTSKKKRCGFVAIIGLPNAGKSTLLNQLLGTKVSIVSPKPQTTRFNIRGVLTRENYQIVFIDTPGIHDAKSLMNKLMVEQALNTLAEVEAILWVLDAANRSPKEESSLLEVIKSANKPTILALNKVDLIKNKNELLPVMDYFSKLYEFKAIVPVSALERDGLDELEEELVKLLPESEFYYPPEMATDLPLRLFVAEIIREKVFLNTYQEIPYSVAVEVNEIEENPENGILVIRATIFCERGSQKGILIGKGGRMLKKVGTLAREELEFLLKRKVYLELWVKTLEGWREKDSQLKRLILPYQ
jgi:GTP-binding protein Era